MSIPQEYGYQDKYNRLFVLLQCLESAILAYSGGVDSTFLLKALAEARIRVLAVIAVSPSMPPGDLETALKTARGLGIPFKIIHTKELDDEKYSTNQPDRCFHCKKELFHNLRILADQEGYAHVLDGSNADDRGDYRPGQRAGTLYEVRSPLMEVELTKMEIRELSRHLGLETWNKPSSPCLSSRFPYGERITLEGLQMVERAERTLKEMGIGELRVRKQGDMARIEVREGDMAKVMERQTRERILFAFKELGFLYICLDLEGFQSGKLNRVLPQE